MNSIEWNQVDVYLENCLERFLVSRFKDKLLIIKLNFMPNGLEAKIKSFIININKETNKIKTEYFNEEYYLGIGKEFFKKIYNEMESKKQDIEGRLRFNFLYKL